MGNILFFFNYETLYRLSRVKSWAKAILGKAKTAPNKQNLPAAGRSGEESRGENMSPVRVNSSYKNRSSRRNKLAGFF